MASVAGVQERPLARLRPSIEEAHELMRTRLKYVAVCEGAPVETWEEVARIAQLPSDAVCVDRMQVWNQRCTVYIVASSEFREICELDILEPYAIIGRNGQRRD